MVRHPGGLRNLTLRTRVLPSIPSKWGARDLLERLNCLWAWVGPSTPSVSRTGPCLSPKREKELMKAHGGGGGRMKPPKRGAPGLGDPAQEPGGRGEAPKHPSTSDAPVRPGAQHWGRGTPEERFSPSRWGTPEPLPASAAPELRVTECSPSGPSTAEDTREVRDPLRPTVSTLEPRAGNPEPTTQEPVAAAMMTED